MNTPHTSRPPSWCPVPSPPPVLSPLTSQMVPCLHFIMYYLFVLFLLLLLYLFHYVWCHLYYYLLFYCSHYFILSLCVLFIIDLFCTHVLQNPTQHSSDGSNLLLFSAALEAMSTGASVLTSLDRKSVV